jgi:hypothetical protein
MSSILSLVRARFDAWANTLTGYGTAGDKSTSTAFYASDELTNYDLFEQLLVGDPIFGKIANKFPAEAFRPGYRLESVDSAKILAEAAKLGDGSPGNPRVDAALIEACTLARATGGGAVICLTAGPESIPIRHGEKLVALRVAGARELRQENATTWKLNSLSISSDRILPFFGEYAPPRQRAMLRGWGVSHFVKPLRIVQQLMTAYGSVAALLADPSQATIRINGLWEALAAGKDEQIQKRLQITDMNRSSGKALVLDTGEEFNRVSTPLSGVAETLQELRAFLALAADMPETELFGRSPAGMNATGESDVRKWYDSIDVGRQRDIGPNALALYTLIANSIGAAVPASIEWGALYSASDKEQSDTGKVRAETADIYINAGVLTPQEVRAAYASDGDLFGVVDKEKAKADLAKVELAYSETPDPEAPDTVDTPDPNAPAARPTVTLTPSDVAQVVTVQEARASQGLPPFTGENARFNIMTVGEFSARKKAEIEKELGTNEPQAQDQTGGPSQGSKAPTNP